MNIMGFFKTFGVLIFINLIIVMHLSLWFLNILIKKLQIRLSGLFIWNIINPWVNFIVLGQTYDNPSHSYASEETLYQENQNFGYLSPIRFFVAGLLPLSCALWGLYKKNLSFSGFISAFFVGFILTLASYSLSLAMISFFLVASKATKFRKKQKGVIDADSKKGSRRTFIQVLCNGSVPCELALVYLAEYWSEGGLGGDAPLDFETRYTASIIKVAALGAIACCCGDTLASELGPVISWPTGTTVAAIWPLKGSRSVGPTDSGDRFRLTDPSRRYHPILVTTGSVVPPGTNGGITLIGLFFSAIGGLVVGLAYYASSRLIYFLSCSGTSGILDSDGYSPLNYDKEWLVIPLGTMAGYMGSIIDSILGATLQYTGYDLETKRVVSEAILQTSQPYEFPTNADSPGKRVHAPSIVPITSQYNFPLLDNHAVNLLSSLSTALIIPVFAVSLWNVF